MKISEKLKAAKQIIINPEAWTQGCIARDPEGEQVSYTDPTAVCYCSFGAILKAVNGGDIRPVSAAEPVVAYLNRSAGSWSSIGGWNDTHSHAEVINGFDTAIALAELEGK